MAQQIIVGIAVEKFYSPAVKVSVSPLRLHRWEYKYALIHCQQYNHLFGSAALVK